MIDAYRMFPVNLALLIFVILVLFFFKFILKRKLNGYGVVFIFSLLPVVSILRKGVYESGDITIHIYRAISFFDSLKNFIIFPSWGEGLNVGYGYPIFTIINPVPYYLISIIHLLGFSFIDSMKIFLILSFILSGLFMYVFSKILFKNELAAITSSIFYLYAPYHLIDLHFRVDIGEILSFTFFPLVCLFFYKCLRDKKNIDYISLGILFGIFILCHQGIAMITFLFLFIFILAYLFKFGFKKSLSNYKLIYTLAISILISAYAIAPYFTLTKYTLINLSSTFEIILNPIQHIFYSPWRYGLLFQGPNGEIREIIGYANLLVLGSIIYFLISNKVKKEIKSYVIFFLFTSLFFIFMVLNESKFIWDIIPLINNILISSRLLFFVSFTCSVLAGYFALIINKKRLVYLLIFFAIITTIINWGNRNTLPNIDDDYLIRTLGSSSQKGEGYAYLQPKWTGSENIWLKENPIFPIKIIEGRGNIINLNRTPQLHQYIVQADTPIKIVESTWFFPGWIVVANNKNINFGYTNKKYPGVINFNLPKGLWHVEVIYKDLLFLQLLKLTSFITFLTSILYIIYFYLGKLKSN